MDPLKSDVSTAGIFNRALEKGKAQYENSKEQKDTFIKSDKDGFFKPIAKEAGGYALGIAGGIAASTAGVTTYVHEEGHAAAIKALYENPEISIQIDSFDNIKNFFKSPSSENLKRIFTGYDLNQDKAAGVTKFVLGDEKTHLGQLLGDKNSMALICAAGCAATEIPALIGFAAGYKMRKTSPLLGYALMSAATVQHINNSAYPISALIPSIAKTPGHDWAKFAQITGINPVVTAAAFASTLPALGYVMYRIEKSAKKTAMKRNAVARLVERQEITPKELYGAFRKYPGRSGLIKAQKMMAEALDTPAGDLKRTGGLKSSVSLLKKEYDKFSDYLADKYPSMVKDEIKNEPKAPARSFSESVRDLKTGFEKAWKEDKVGTALTAGTVAGTAGISSAFAVAATMALSGSATVASAITSAVIPAIPVVGVLGAANSINTAGKIIKNAESTKFDKIIAVGTAALSTLSAAGLLGLGAPFVAAGACGVLALQLTKAAVKALS